MAVYNVKRMPIFIDSQMVAEAENATVRINTNGERQHAQEGVIAISTGNLEVEISCSTIRTVTPGGGHSKMEDALFNQSVVTASAKIGSKMLVCPVKWVSGEFSSDSRTGTLKGSFTANNAGNPDLI